MIGPGAGYSIEWRDPDGRLLFTENGRYVVRGSTVAFTAEDKTVFDHRDRPSKGNIDGYRQGQLIAKHRMQYEGRTWVWTNK